MPRTRCGAIDASRIETVGRDAAQPVTSNDTESGRAQNRRLELVAPMKRASLCLLALTAILAGGIAQAENAQQERMKSCNARAAGKTGAERQAFMSECLHGEAPSQGVKATSQQQKMKDCNKGGR